MLSIAVYSTDDDEVEHLKSIIQDFLIEMKIMARVSFFNEPDHLITIPTSYDIYIMDVDSEGDILSLGTRMMDIDIGSYFIYISDNIQNAYQAAKTCADYCLTKPIEKEDLIRVLRKIRKKVQEDNIIIKVANGERRIRANTLNYINIVKRCLCYHLKDGAMFDGQTLRSSFEKAIFPLQTHPGFLFLAPSLLINLGEVKEVNTDSIIFENDEILYYPKKSHDVVLNAWKSYIRFIN